VNEETGRQLLILVVFMVNTCYIYKKFAIERFALVGMSVFSPLSVIKLAGGDV